MLYVSINSCGCIEQTCLICTLHFDSDYDEHQLGLGPGFFAQGLASRALSDPRPPCFGSTTSSNWLGSMLLSSAWGLTCLLEGMGRQAGI